MNFQTEEDFAFYQHFYENLTKRVFIKLLKGEEDDAKNIPYGMWDKFNDPKYKGPEFEDTFKSKNVRCFYKVFGRAKKERPFDVGNEPLSAALDFLGIADTSQSLKTKLERQIAAYREKYDLPSSGTYPEKKPETPKRGQYNSVDIPSFKKLIGYTGVETVYILLKKKVFDQPNGYSEVGINSFDRKASKHIKNILRDHNIPYIEKEAFDEPIEIDKSGAVIFIVIGFFNYGNMMIEDLNELREGQGSFFKELFFEWVYKSSTYPRKRIRIKGGHEISSNFDEREEETGTAVGMLAKFTRKAHTVVFCGGLGEQGTGAIGDCVERHWKEIFEHITAKTTNIHSYSVFLELEIEEPSNYKIIDSTILSVF